MVCIETVVGYAANPGATFTAVTFNQGQSGAVRAFNQGDFARLEKVWRSGAAAGAVQLKSPRLHDNVRGLQWTSSTNPTVLLMPRNIGQPLFATDTLAVSVTGGTAETDFCAFNIYYSTLGGSDGKYFMWSDIAPRFVNYKIMEVDITTSATAGVWTDAVITTTENLLEADTQYAVLGYITDVNCGAVGIYGTDTGNIRHGGPGTSLTYDTSEYFIQCAEREGTPHIPVINSNNRGAIFATAADSAASTAVKIQFILGQLTGKL
jgi:hypothetical protein